jgi:hypothetical protein
VPASPYLAVVYRYADALLDERRGGACGFDLERDENFLRILYVLSGLSGKPKYRDAADRELKLLLEGVGARETGLFPFGERRAWLLWDRCFELDPEASRRIALRLAKRAGETGSDSPRKAAFLIRAFAASHRCTGDAAFLKPIAVVLEKLEGTRATGALPAHRLSLAIDCEGASRLVPEPLAARLRAIAAREDEGFSSLAHDLKGKGGFVAEAVASGGYTSPWEGRGAVPTTAQVALECVARYENSGKTSFRGLIEEAADAYLKADPGKEVEVPPLVFGHAISLQLAAWRSTARAAYLDRARALADRAVRTFWSGENPLPRAGSKPSAGSEGGGAIPGADTLALGLLELHLSILAITAVDCPPNTADR